MIIYCWKVLCWFINRKIKQLWIWHVLSTIQVISSISTLHILVHVTINTIHQCTKESRLRTNSTPSIVIACYILVSQHSSSFSVHNFFRQVFMAKSKAYLETNLFLIALVGFFMSSSARKLATPPETNSYVDITNDGRNSEQNSISTRLLSLHVSKYLGTRKSLELEGASDRVSPGGPNPGHH